MSDNQRDLLRQYIKRVGARRACWRTLRQLSIASLVFTVGIYIGYWPPIAIWLLGVLVLAVVILESPSTTARVMDRLGGHLGLIECALDHLQSEEAIVVAQRKRAWERIGDTKVGDYAPAPSALWWLPVLSVIAVAIYGQSVTAQGDNEMRSGSAVQVMKPQPEQSKLVRQKPPKEKAETAVDGRKDVVQNTITKSAKPTVKSAKRKPQMGQKTGSISGDETGVKFVAIESKEASPTLKIKGSSQTSRSSGKIDGRIVEPARPFPPQYHQVIETWFRRQKQ